jgi:hypothetical protein
MAGLGSLEAPEPALFVEEGLTRGSLEGFRPYLGRSPGFCCCCEESYVTPPRSVEVPEPSTWALMLTGAVIILAARLYRRRKQ